MITVEIAIEDVEGAVTAELSGAHRVEICSSLSVGGLTPSIGLVEEIVQRTSTIELAIMIRPRAGNFVYSPSEIATMASDIKALSQIDFSHRKVSFVFGALQANNELDIEALKTLGNANPSISKSFHMAFDSTPNLEASMESLISLGFDRILTSGGASRAIAGIDVLKKLNQLSSGRITLIAGGSVRAHNAREIVDHTGITEIHLRAAEQVATAGSGKYDSEPIFTTSGQIISEVISALDSPALKPAIVAIDVGGTSLKGALLTPEYEILARSSAPTVVATLNSDLDALIARLFEEAHTLNRKVLSLAVITPGAIEESKGIVKFASNLGWRDYPLADNLRTTFKVPVAVGHDVRTSSLAEGAIGTVQGVKNYISVAVGTGIAAGIVSNGQIISGASGSAGEGGHMPLVVDGPICPCGQRGCWERYSSGNGISERYRELTGEEKSAQEIIQSAASSEDCAKVWRDALAKTAHALAILSINIDPEKIVIGGGVAAGYANSLDDLRQQVQGFLAWKKAPEILISTLGNDAGIFGAALLALQVASL